MDEFVMISTGIGVLAVVILLLFLRLSVRIARPWERAIVLRLGHLRGVRGPARSC